METSWVKAAIENYENSVQYFENVLQTTELSEDQRKSIDEYIQDLNRALTHLRKLDQ